jgi:hypothetical protein
VSDSDQILVRATMKYVAPKTWRLFRVPSAMTLSEMDEVVRTGFGWRGEDEHWWTQRDAGEERAWVSPVDAYLELVDTSEADEFLISDWDTIGDVIARGGLVYRYGAWSMNLRKSDDPGSYRVPISGDGRAVLLDSGGVAPFEHFHTLEDWEDFLRIAQNPADKSYEEAVRWAEQMNEIDLRTYDFSTIDFDGINEKLAEIAYQEIPRIAPVAPKEEQIVDAVREFTALLQALGSETVRRDEKDGFPEEFVDKVIASIGRETMDRDIQELRISSSVLIAEGCGLVSDEDDTIKITELGAELLEAGDSALFEHFLDTGLPDIPRFEPIDNDTDEQKLNELFDERENEQSYVAANFLYACALGRGLVVPEADEDPDDFEITDPNMLLVFAEMEDLGFYVPKPDDFESDGPLEDTEVFHSLLAKMGAWESETGLITPLGVWLARTMVQRCVARANQTV